MCWTFSFYCIIGVVKWGQAQDMILSSHSFRQTAELHHQMIGTGAAMQDESADMGSDAMTGKRPGMGMLMSIIVPGAGECYAGSWIKGAIFFAAEVGLWVGYSYFHGEGKDYEDTFEF